MSNLQAKSSICIHFHAFQMYLEDTETMHAGKKDGTNM